MSEANNEEEHSVPQKGPGELLQVARIKQSITVDDIARQMNLNAKILQSIEDDDYSDIQSPIFVRGYLRTYARLVGVDEDNVIKLFGNLYQQDEHVLKSIGNTTPEISSNDFRVKWMTYAVVLGLVVLLSVWWVNNYKGKVFDVAQDEAESHMEKPNDTPLINSLDINKNNAGSLTITEINSIEADENNLEDLTQNTIEDNQSEESVNINIGNATVEEVIETDELSQIEEEIESNNITEQTEFSTSKNTLENVADLAVTSIEQSADENSDMITPSQQYIKEKSAPSGTDVLELTIIAASWGDIKDASKFKLIQDLLKAGNSYKLVGKAPFKIFLGNGYGVEIKLNGESIDFSKHIKNSNNTARFELEK